MAEYLKSLPERPPRVAALPLTDSGFPVLWFAALVDGKPDLRIAAAGKREAAILHDLCWVCGGKLGRYKAFVIGPMCAVNRVTSEPPCHLECARYAAAACPFLTKPRMRRNTVDLPAGYKEPPGINIPRNPGATCIWVVDKPFKQGFWAVKVGENAGGGGAGWLIRLGDPRTVEWWAEGRQATLEEVQASIDSGMPLLMEVAVQDGEKAVAALGRQREMVNHYLPQDPFSLAVGGP